MPPAVIKKTARLWSPSRLVQRKNDKCRSVKHCRWLPPTPSVRGQRSSDPERGCYEIRRKFPEKVINLQKMQLRCFRTQARSALGSLGKCRRPGNPGELKSSFTRDPKYPPKNRVVSDRRSNGVGDNLAIPACSTICIA